MTKTTILVAGGAGYIGSHFCYLAAQHGFTPIVIDRLNSPFPVIEDFRRRSAKWGHLEIADIGDVDAITDIIKRHKPIAAVCFAALIDVAESVANPEMYWENNFYKATTFFQTLKRCSVEHIVFSSTAAVYGNPVDGLPLQETSPHQPINTYGLTKLGCEIVLQGKDVLPALSTSTYNAIYEKFKKTCLPYDTIVREGFAGLNSIIFRYFNAAGAAPQEGLGEMHEPETHMIPNALFAAHRLFSYKDETRTLIINGNDYPTPDGTCVRDYVHVIDLAAAHIAGLKHLLNGGTRARFNLGTGTGYSLHEIVESVRSITGKDFVVKIGPRREGDPARLVADATKAKTILNWAPQHGLSAIIHDANSFYLNNCS